MMLGLKIAGGIGGGILALIVLGIIGLIIMICKDQEDGNNPFQ